MTLTHLPSDWLPIADALVKATMVLLLAAIASLFLRRASAALRHLVWTLALCSALVLPVLTFALPKWQLPLFTIEAGAGPQVVATTDSQTTDPWLPPLGGSSAAAGAFRLKAEATSSATTSASEVAAPPVPNPAASWLRHITVPQALFAIWAAGALLILGRVAIGFAAIRWLSRRTQEITDAAWLPMARALASELGVTSRLRFLRSGRATMPVATGVFRPSIIMPADADAWSESRLRIVLLHELAHVKRRDCLTHLLAQAACAFYWFNPLAWLAVKRARTERERACDDLVLTCGTGGPEYADQLLEMARALRGDRFPALLAGASLAMAHQSQLEGRLIAILDPKLPRAALSRGRTLAVVTLCCCAIAPLGALQAWATGNGSGLMLEQPSVNAQAADAGHSSGDRHDAARASRTDISETPQRPVAHADVQTSQGPQTLQGPQAPQRLQQPQPGQTPQVSRLQDSPSPSPTPMPMPMPMPNVRAEEWTAPEAIAEAAREGAAAALAQTADAAAEAARKGRGRGEGAEQVDPKLRAALLSALKDTDKEVRETALQALVQMRDPSVFDPLVQALKDSSADVREHAAFGLGQLRDKRAIQPLMSVLKDDTNASVREQAVFALGQLRDPAAVEALAVALRDSNASVREQAAFALGQIRDRRAVEPLISALKDAAPDVREQAAFALGQIGDRAAVEALIIAVKDTNADVREQVVFALGQIRDARAIDALTIALKDTSVDVRQQAAFALGQLAR